jgi:2-(1,2-epoxy-1,2-dihydrophenyl)acetyl-CoA isomerase
MSEVLTTRDGAVLTITLNRPEVLNALDIGMHERLAAALEEGAHPDVRAVVVTGAGRGFCVGQDVSQFPPDAEAVGELLRRHFNPAILAIRGLEKPVIAAVNGPAAGAGLALAMACDLRLAAASASFVPAFAGPAAAFDWIVSGRKVDAEEAAARGLVSRVVPDTELAGEAAALAADLAARPTRAIALTKRLIDEGWARTLVDQLEHEALLQVEAAASADFAEGVAAFREKRPPRFQGR